ncbi:hypothetical protein [Actinokineospora terrae]|uniref:Uncharacterized protein n=1 Tax=Actinokineospora terrae TaxID=155974 RepID=A0A1H9W0D8_9PSEU|nr:hypothetical protein [Actinokineospora terrae]SES27239.1 hypothetical protein SAMN04487818_109234 [Actinokineospora terrae]
MSKENQKSASELAKIHSDPQWRISLIRLINLTALMRESIIGRDYRISDDLNNAIYLTREGDAIKKTLITKHEVPAKEAKLMCFLVFAYRDLFVDVEATNYVALVREIGKQVKSGSIRHPFVFGRALYDKAAELFPDERRYLSVADTMRLLDETPYGVWQAGDLVTGPYGIIRSKVHRDLPPSTEVPLQHCADLTCNTIHYVRLSTAYDAPVNAHRPKLTRLLEGDGIEPSEWNRFISELIYEKVSVHDDSTLQPLTNLLGDGLDEPELRILLARLLDLTGEGLREVAASVGLRGKASSMVAELSRAELLQLTLYCSDDEILRNLDELVRTREIVVPPGEQRRARVNGREWIGAWQLEAVLGHQGVTVRAPSSRLAVLRMHRLVKALYKVDKVDDMHNLDWQLRGLDAVTPAAKLAEYLRSVSPEAVLRNLILARRENAEYACTTLGLPDIDQLGDDELVAMALWKLGFSTTELEVPHGKFFEHLKEMLGLAKAAQLSSSVDEEPIRRASVVLYEKLEGLLVDVLAYVTWALINDHYASDRPFEFRGNLEFETSCAVLNASSANAGTNGVDFSAPLTLNPLIRGLGILSEHLDGLREGSEKYLRPKDSIPDYVRRTSIQEFPFGHVHPFLDLDGRAQKTIIDGLQKVRHTMESNNVASSRNDLSHFRRSSVDMTKLVDSLEAMNQAVGLLDSLGFVRLPFIHEQTKSDEWGRRTVILKSPTGQRVSFSRPSAYDSLLLPRLDEPQYLMHSATFAEPNEVLRFRPGFDSPYQDMWVDFPKRRMANRSIVANQSESGAANADGTNRSSSRLG